MKRQFAPLLMIPIIILLLSSSNQVHACSCLSLTPCEAFGWADAVFIGRVISGTENSRDVAIFEVDEIFKGLPRRQIEVHILKMKGTSCEGMINLATGESYLVYASDYKGNLILGPCSSPKRLTAANEDLSFLRNLPPPGSGGRLYGEVHLDYGEENPPPLPNITIAIQNEKGERQETVTKSNGHFEFSGLKPGQYTVEPIWAEYYVVYSPQRKATVSDRGCSQTLYWAQIDGRVSGEVFDVNRRPAVIDLHLMPVVSEKKFNGLSVRSSLNGKFEFKGVPPGEYSLFIGLEPGSSRYSDDPRYFYPGVLDRGQAEEIRLGTGQKVDRIEFLLPEQLRVRTISGQVLMPNGRPAAKVDIVLIEDSSRLNRRIYVYQYYLTDRHGYFSIPVFQGRSYQLVVRNDSSILSGRHNKALHSERLRIKKYGELENLRLVLSKPGFFEEPNQPSEEKKVP